MSGGRRKRKPEKPVAQPAPVAKRVFNSRTLIVALGLIAACVAVFASVRHHDFVYYDDPKYITENPIVQAGLTSRGLAWALTTGTDANWFPLTWVSHMLDVQLYGLNAGGHHVTNLILHIASTLLLFAVLLWMTGALGRSAFVAGLFALHPLHVESVAWVAERKDVLSTLFWMLTLGAYVWYTRQPRVNRYLLVLALFAAGLMSKPMLVTLPFVLFLLDHWPLDRKSMPFAKLVREKVPLLAIALASSIVTFIVQRKGGAVGGLDAYPLVLRIGNALVSYVTYMGRMLWPARLTAFYPYPETLSGGKVLGAVVILAGISFFAIRSARRRPYLIVGWLWFLGSLVPVIGLVQVGNQAMADRYTYVPLIGLFIIIAWGAHDLLARWSVQRIALPIVGTLALAVCAIVARAQVQHWANSSALWTHALRVTDENYVAHNNLGLAFMGQGRIDEAVIQYNEALRIRPNYTIARTNLGAALSKQGKTADAISNYAEVLKQKPNMAETHTNLGAALASQGRIDEAIAAYNEALRLRPGYPEAHANLGLALASQGKVNEAIAQYVEALKVKPDFVEVHNNLGYALASLGHFDEAISHYGEAIRLKPDFELARINLAMTLANQKKTDEALTAFMEVLRINPTNDVARSWIDQLAEERRKTR
ncbi:MAG: tetratricopeptide repeat protein [Gemmatimonadaceae bacterium]